MPDFAAESIYLTALLVGLLGGVHCLGMCGGVVGTLSFSVPIQVQKSPMRMTWYQLSYNLGRLSSYALIGALFGFLGSQLISFNDIAPIQASLQIVAGVFMIVLGLYLANWWFGIVWVEKAGQGLWYKIKPLAQKLLPVKNLPHGFLYGLFWGWLPCGLVYSMLIMAMSSGSAVSGGLVMLAFGLGTLPNLLLMGSFAFFFTRLSQNIVVKRIAGSSVILMGLWQISFAF